MFYKSWHTARLTGLVGLGLPVWLQLASSLASIRKLIRVYAWWSKWTAFCAPKGEHTGDNTAPSAEFVSGNQLARARLLGYCARVHGSIGALHCSKSGSKRTNVALRIMSSLRYDACHHDSLTLISHSQLGEISMMLPPRRMVCTSGSKFKGQVHTSRQHGQHHHHGMADCFLLTFRSLRMGFSGPFLQTKLVLLI